MNLRQIRDDLLMSTPEGEPYIWPPRRLAGDRWRLSRNQPFGKDRPFYTRGDTADDGSALPAAYSAIGQISNELEGCPRALIDKRTKKAVEAHPLNVLLESPSRQMDAYHFWVDWMYGAAVATGNSYAYIARDRRTNRPVELVPAICHDTQWSGERRRRRRFEIELLGDEGRKTRRVREGNVLTFHGRGFDGLVSPSPIQVAARSAIDQSLTVRDAIDYSLENGVFASILLRLSTAIAGLSPDKRDELEDKMRREYAGVQKAGSVMVLPPDLEVVEGHKLSAVDMQLIENLKWNVEDIARVWSISPWRLGHFPATARRPEFSAESAAFERTACRPWARMGDSAMNQVGKLLMREDADNGFRVDTDTSQIAHGTLQDRVQIAGQAVADYGMWRGNEGRELTGKPPDPEMDKFFAPRGGTPAAGGNSGRRNSGMND